MSANICRGTATSAIWKIATAHPGVGEGVRFAMDSALEGSGFELSVPRQRFSVYRVIRSVAARDRDVGADVSVQPGFCENHAVTAGSIGCSVLLFSRRP